MTKQTVTRFFIGSVAAVVAGIVLAIGAVSARWRATPWSSPGRT